MIVCMYMHKFEYICIYIYGGFVITNLHDCKCALHAPPRKKLHPPAPLAHLAHQFTMFLRIYVMCIYVYVLYRLKCTCVSFLYAHTYMIACCVEEMTSSIDSIVYRVDSVEGELG